jgi:hypothetical protein
VDLNSLLRPLGLTSTVQLLLASLATMFVLALLVFIGAVFAKEWTDTRNPLWFAAGLATFALLFAFYARSPKTAELSVVTIGWVVFLQVGLVLYERLRYDAALPPAKWAAVALILFLQTSLILTPATGGPAAIVQPATIPVTAGTRPATEQP